MKYSYFTLLTAILLLLLLSASSVAAEDDLHQGNISGNSGWDLYDPDELEEDERISEKEKLELQRKEAKLSRQQKRGKDFFAVDSDVFDKSISRTFKEEKAAHGKKVSK